MVVLSESERLYIQGGVEQDIRADGRNTLSYRTLSLQTSVVTQASGSARVKLATTDVLIGIKAEIAETKPESPNEGYIVCSVECSASASQEFEGRGAEDLNRELSQQMQRMLGERGALDLGSLCIIPSSNCWVLYVDALVLDFGGNLLDAIMIGAQAALKDTRIPNVSVLEDEEGNKEIEISDDPDDVTPLDISNVPLSVTLHLIQRRYLVDATLEEECCSEGKVVVGVTRGGKVRHVQKGGAGVFLPSTLVDMVSAARKIALDTFANLDAVLAKEEEAHKAEDRAKAPLFL